MGHRHLLLHFFCLADPSSIACLRTENSTVSISPIASGIHPVNNSCGVERACCFWKGQAACCSAPESKMMNSTRAPWLDVASLPRRLKHWPFGPVFYLIRADISPQESASTQLKHSPRATADTRE